jgi:hypothetical protein
MIYLFTVFIEIATSPYILSGKLTEHVFIWDPF